MKKSLIILGTLAITLSNAQTESKDQTKSEYRGRVGINTDSPKASLHIGRHTGISEKSPQGLLLPHFSTEERNKFKKKDLVEGLMIYNTKKNCIDWWDGSFWSCTNNGNDKEEHPADVEVPAGLTIGSSKLFIASLQDDRYPSINIQGTITTGGIDVFIPVTFSEGTTNVEVPAHQSSEFLIPAEAIKDSNGNRRVVLYWDKQTLNKPNQGTTYIKAKLKAVGGDINIKQYSIGDNSTGISLGNITYPSTTTNASGASLDLRAIAGIPDKKFNDSNKPEHQFIYHPIEITVSGKKQIWLNNNLGADYANVHSEHFNPAQQAKYYGDHNAYGSLFQWGREADGHELMDWTNLNTGVPKNSAMPWKSVAQLSTYTENCPVGFRLPNKDEYTALRNEVNKGSDNAKAFVSLGLRFPNSSHRINTNGTVTDRSDAKPGIRFYLWSSTPSEASNDKAYSVFAQANNIDRFNASNDRSYGFALRCIVDTSTDSGSNGGGVTPVPPPPGGGGNGGGSNGGTPIQLPPNVTLSSSEKFVVSIYDNDYLPYSVPTAGASYASKAADGNADPLVDIQGSIDNTGVEVFIPVQVQGGGSATIPAYQSAPITVLGKHTQEGQSRQLVLTWDEQRVSGANTFINAKIKTVDGVLNIKKLDINNGVGSDARGVQLGNAKIEYPASTSTQGAQQKATLDLRAIAGIPDKKYGVETNGELEHQFIYIPIKGPDGRTWLNNNLGAEYAKVGSPHFNPARQAGGESTDPDTIKQDWKAYGSFFEWGRDSDGHELINWTSSTSGAVINTGLVPGTLQSTFIEANDPCPAGYHTPTQAEQNALFNAINNTNHSVKTIPSVNSSNFWNENTLRLPASGVMSPYDESKISISGNSGFYWSSSEDDSGSAWHMGFYRSSSSLYHNYFNRTFGQAVRCISDR